MPDYVLIDEIEPDEPNKKDPWSPWAIFLLTVFGGAVIGGIMGIMNYKRLNIEGRTKTIAIYLVIAAVILPFLPLLGFDRFGMELTKDFSKEIGSALKFLLAYYLFGTQKKQFENHIEVGGKKASTKGPVIITVVFAVVVLMAMGAGVMYFLNNPPPELSGSTLAPGSISAPYGTSPIIDGAYTVHDGWNETEPIIFTSNGVNYSIAAKHDGTVLYILLMWEGGPEWENSVSLFFEQDGDSHDHNMSTGRNDEKYNGAEKYGPSSLYDAHWEGGVSESRDGMVKGGYSDGVWVQEWVLPLRSGDTGDIYVDQFPTTLGFGVNWGLKKGSWPYKVIYWKNPHQWGDLVIMANDDMVIESGIKELNPGVTSR